MPLITGSTSSTPSFGSWPCSRSWGARDELAPGIRSFPFGRYLVFYLPISDGIDVVRVLHGARDVDKVFGEDNP